MRLTSSAEGGTSGTNVTTGNSGGASGNAWDLVTATGGTAGIITFDSAHAAHGALGYSLSIGSTASECYLQWLASLGGTFATLYSRAYAYLTASPGTTFKLIRFLTAGSANGGVTVTTAGKLATINAAGTAVATSTNSVPLNQWFRVEFDSTASATVGTLICRLYQGADDVSPLETLTSTAQNTGAGPMDTIRFGPTGTAVANIGPFWIDDAGVTDAGPMGPSVTAGSVAPHIGGTQWRRRFRHRQQLPLPPPSVTAPQAGPPVYPLQRPVMARALPAAGGRVTSRAGVYRGTGPPLKPPAGPVRTGVPLPVRGGSTSSRAGTYGRTGPPARPLSEPVKAQPGPLRSGHAATRSGTLTAGAPQTGPPVYPLGHPVTARRLQQRGGSVSHRAGTFSGAGPPLRPLDAPVKAEPPPSRGGRATGRAGTFTVVVTGTGPPIYPPHGPVAGKRLPARSGNVSHRAGLFAGAGPPVPALKQPAGQYRRQPPPPARGRVMSLRGARSGTGPPVPPLRRPVRARLPRPLLTGRSHATLIPPVAVPPPPFTIAQLSAATSGSALAAQTAAGGPLTAVYPATYGGAYGAAPSATLAAATAPATSLTAAAASSALTAATASSSLTAQEAP